MTREAEPLRTDAAAASRSWLAVAPDALATFRAIERGAAGSIDAAILAPVQQAVAAILAPGRAATAATGGRDDHRDRDDDHDPRADACVAFAEQFVVDVAGITTEQRAAMLTAMGSDAFTFVQVLFVADVFTRARIAFEQLFAEPFRDSERADDAGDAGGLWPLLETFMQRVALLDALDPLTTELVRLRGARVHNCRLCQSRRSVKAVDAAGGLAALDADEAPDERTAVATRLADALVTQPRTIDSVLVTDVHRHFSVAEVVEIVLDVVRNAANKIAVALGADEAVVRDGVEFYDIDARGDVVADVDIDVVRAATAG